MENDLILRNLDKFLSEVDSGIKLSHSTLLSNLKMLNDDTTLRQQKKVVKRDLGDQPVLIVPLSDLHVGHKICNLNKLMLIVQMLLMTDNCYTILLGDLAETATRSSIGMGIFEEDLHYDDQMEFLEKILQPLADQGKILGMLPGNHEMRVANILGTSPTKELAKSIGVEYLGYQGFLSLKVGNQRYSIMCHHGLGGGRTKGSKVSSAMRLSDIAVADVYVSGHTHDLSSSKDVICVFDDNGDLKEIQRHFVVASSFLEYWDGYAEMKALPIAQTGASAIQLMPDKKQIIITQ